MLAGKMFSRWSQANFLKYMMEHFGIDRLIEYKQEEIDETTKVVNPLYRELESTIRYKTTLLSRQQAKYGALILETTDGKEKEIEQLKATKKTRTNISSFPSFRKEINFRI